MFVTVTVGSMIAAMAVNVYTRAVSFAAVAIPAAAAAVVAIPAAAGAVSTVSCVPILKSR